MQNATIRMPIIAKKIIGKMIWFNFEDNRGLIERLDTHEVIYVHKNEMMEPPSVNNELYNDVYQLSDSGMSDKPNCTSSRLYF